jgi:MFS family permease
MDDIGWYGSAFFLTLAAFQSPWGHVYRGFSLRGSFLTAIGIFEIGSLVCALAPNSIALIVGRAIQGMGGAGLTGGCYTIAAFIAPPKTVPILIGLLGSTFSVASIAGPLLGGVFSQHITWRWCFYINLPIGGVAAGVLLFFFRTPEQAKSGMGRPLKEKLEQFDFIGLVVLLAGLICFFLALQWGGVTKPWSDGSVIACLVLWVVLTGAFLGIEWWQKDRALMVPRLLANRNIGACCAYIFL